MVLNYGLLCVNSSGEIINSENYLAEKMDEFVILNLFLCVNAARKYVVSP